jgi:hypothetical protein
VSHCSQDLLVISSLLIDLCTSHTVIMIGPQAPPLPTSRNEDMYPLSPSSTSSGFGVPLISSKPSRPKRSFSYLGDVSQPTSLYPHLTSTYLKPVEGVRPNLLRGHSEQPSFNTTWNPLDASDFIRPPLPHVVERRCEDTGITTAPCISMMQEANFKTITTPTRENSAQTPTGLDMTRTNLPSSTGVNHPMSSNRDPGLPNAAKQGQVSSIIRTCSVSREKRDASVQTDAISFIDVTHSPTFPIKAREESFLPPTPPISSESLPSLTDKASGSRSPNMHKIKRRKKRRMTTESTPDTPPVPVLSYPNEFLEVVDLEKMVDKSKAFEQLLAIYKQQRYLRDAEEELNQRRIADLTAGIISHEMENLRLMELLHHKGVPFQEIQDAPTFHEPFPPPAEPYGKSSNISQDSQLDISRFTMLKKVDQLGRMRQFNWPQNEVGLPLAENKNAYFDVKCGDIESERALPVNDADTSNTSTPHDSSQPPFAGVSLIDPYSDADNIDQKMKTLEMEFISSQSRGSSQSTISINANPTTMIRSHSMNSDDLQIKYNTSTQNRNRDSPNPNLTVQDRSEQTSDPLTKGAGSFSFVMTDKELSGDHTRIRSQGSLPQPRSTLHLRTRSESDVEHLFSRANNNEEFKDLVRGTQGQSEYSHSTSKVMHNRSVDLGFVSLAMDIRDTSWDSLLNELMRYPDGELHRAATQDTGRGLGLAQG